MTSRSYCFHALRGARQYGEFVTPFRLQGDSINSTASDEQVKSKSSLRRRFGVYMVISFTTKMLLTILLVEILHLEEFLAYAIALVIGSIQNFFILMCWVYKTSEGSKWQQFVKFVQSIAGFQLAEWLLFLLLEEIIGVPYKRAVALTMAASALMKFFVYKTFVFRGKHPQPDELTALDVPLEKAEEWAAEDEPRSTVK